MGERTLVAPFKTPLLSQLVDEYLASIAHEGAESVHASPLWQHLNATAQGDIGGFAHALKVATHSGCDTVRLDCRLGFVIRGIYDLLMVWLGRSLGYHSLFSVCLPKTNTTSFASPRVPCLQDSCRSDSA